MYQTKTKKILILLLALALTMAMFAGCGSNDSDDGAATDEDVAGEVKVTLDIDFPDSSGVADVEDVVIGLPADQSVLDLLYAYANDNNMEIKADKNSYVTSIGGVAAKGDSGWTFEVNDKPITTTAGETILKNGDEVSWEYVSASEMGD